MRIDAIRVRSRTLKRVDPQWRTSSYKADEVGAVYVAIDAGGVTGVGATASHPRRLSAGDIVAQLTGGVVPALQGRPVEAARRQLAGLRRFVEEHGLVSIPGEEEARIEEAPDVVEPSAELEALTRNVQSTFAQIIEHKWLLSEQAGRDIGMGPAVQSYLTDVLAHKPDEQAVLGIEIGSLSSVEAGLR